MANSPIRMVCLDLDGTVLNSAREITDATVNTLRKIDAMGIQVALVTGRSKGDTSLYAKRLSLSKPTPIVCYNGSYGFMVDTNTDQEDVLFSSGFPPEQARILLNLADKLGLVAQYYNGATGDVYAKPSNDEHRALLQRYAELTGKPQVIVTSYEECFSLTPSAKLLVLTNDTDSLLAAAAKELPPGAFQVLRGSNASFYCEFMMPDTGNKGAGLRRLCECMNIPIECCAGFGDGENDREFLTVAGLGCAMKNAKPAAKAAANVVIDWTNDEDGVALHLEKMIVEGLLRNL